ncbi:TonB-dependent receptor [Microbulbifer rhizosphaerae]|uniref:Iron complex outermembrane receptor protein n=1 Tax=Microbulbifer rhizosphaerae TaxID=1562603 RepID=A0A7W4Z7J6_9GAMM|nr:TonB-dependent receptor [Microbulbifer rhizosphaerae]MBB3059818.1 iron complex outermembrane receptor protein [Microbulbifer rhizosphaerae]
MKKKQLSLAIGLAGNLTLVLWGQPGIAQQAREIEEVVVTAQKRSENLQDVPISVSAIQGDALTRAGYSSIQDLAGAVPSLVVSDSVSYGLAPVAIRGIGGPAGSGSLLTEQPVAVYVDGVYVRALGQSVADFLDVDNIQVLRGPQGTLYGRNSTAGALLIDTRRPSGEFSGYTRFSYDSYDNAKVSGAVNLPLIEDVLAMRAAISHRSGGDWAENIIDGREFGGGRGTAGRVSLRFTPNSDVTVDLIGEIARGEDRPATLQLATLELGPVIPGLPLQLYQGSPHVRRSDYEETLDDREVQIIGKQYTETESENVTLLADWQLSEAVTLASVTGYRHFNVSGFQDSTPWVTGALPGTPGAEFWNNLTGMPPPNNRENSRLINPANSAFSLGWNTSDQDYTSWSQELRLASDSGSFRWTAGLYYAYEEVDGFIRIVNEQGGPPMAAPGIPPLVPGSAAGLDLGFNTTQETHSYAVFADGTLDLSDTWSLTGGLRYSRDEKEATVTNTVQTLRTSVVPPLDAGTTVACPGATNDCEASFEKVTPRVVLNFAPTDSGMYYASYSRGFTSGGFNNFGDIGGTLPDRPLEVGSETITNYELGAKHELFNRRARLNISAFWSDYNDLQIRQAVNTGGVAIINVPEARTRGIEFEGLLRATENLTLTLNGSWLDTEILDGTLFGFPDDIGTITMGSLQTPAAVDVSGNRMTRSPEWIGNFSADYRYPTSFGYISGQATLRMQSETHFTETNQDLDQFIGESWEEVDLRLAVGPDDEKWEIALFARNIFDDRHATQIVPFFNLPNATLNAPRTLGVSFSLSRH